MSESPHDSLGNPVIFMVTMIVIGLLFLAAKFGGLFFEDPYPDDPEGW